MAASPPELRYTIATVAQRTGLSVHTLRAWERRYGIPSPARSATRYRLYGPGDLDLIRRMQSFIAEGAGPIEAARRARAGEPTVPAGAAEPIALRAELLDACVSMDPRRVQGLFSVALTALGVVSLVDDIVVPFLHEVGELWSQGAVGVDVEHFASHQVRSRLGGLVAALEAGSDQRALLVCPPGERHDLALVALSVRFLRAGWQVSALGADLPVADCVAAVRRHTPDLVGISVTEPRCLAGAVETSRAVRAVAPLSTHVLVGGQAVTGDTRLPEGVEGEAGLPHLLRVWARRPPAG